MEEFLLTEKAVQDYYDFIKDIQPIIEREIQDPSEIPDEEFKVDGERLEIFVHIAGKKYSYFFEKEDWIYAS